MKIQFTLGDNEQTNLEIERDWFTGSFSYRENGKKHFLRSPFDLATHLNFTLSHEYEFSVGEIERHRIKLIHTRPLWFGGFRPHSYKVFSNGDLLDSFSGY